MLMFFAATGLGCSMVLEEESLPLADELSHLQGVRLFTCIQFERRQWGSQTDRCKVELIFYHPEDSTPPQARPIPEEGECLYFEADEQPQPFDITMDGIDAGESLKLVNDLHSIDLIRETSSEFGIVYDMLDCTEDSFPFGEIFDLIVYGSELPEGVPEFKLEDAVLFGKDLHYSNATEELTSHNPEEDWVLSWEWLGETTADSFIEETRRQLLVNNQLHGHDLEGLVCTPTENGQLVSAEDFGQFIYLQEAGVSGMVDYSEMVMGPNHMLPWGEPFNSTMNYRQVGESSWQ